MLLAVRRPVTAMIVLALPFLIFARTAPLRGADETGKPENRDAAGALVPLPRQAPDVPWPGNDWPSGPLPTGVAADRLDRALAVVNARDARLGETRAVVIVQRGRLVMERYMAGFGPETPLISWSMAKSVTQALVGIAVRRGLVAIDEPMGNPRWPAGDGRAAITWRAWINMVDGQKYDEIGSPDPTRNDAARMLFGEGRFDVAGFAAGLPLVHPPGSHWNYNSAGVNLIADALGRVFSSDADATRRRARLSEVMKEELFGPLGMTSAEPEFDKAGTFIGSAFVYATARDWARFGLLYLRDGVWKERRILPEGWVDFARSKTTADNCDIYGAGWWITPPAGEGKPHRALVQSGPRDTFIAQGHEGQLVVVVPSKDLVLVRLGLFDDRKGFGALGEWVGSVVALFPDAAP
ncbi:MAG TPA: serine hydrolase [Polyangiaceae bacterium]|nr:serine hydrolase [Polyangiaceae bacterium]